MMTIKRFASFSATAVLIPLLLIFANVDLLGASGSPDPTFGAGGVATNIFADIHPIAVEQQQGGKLLVLCYTGEGSSRRIVVRRHNANGSLDSSFGYHGEAVKSYVPLFNLVQRVYGTPIAFKVQSDGKILVAGETTDPKLAAVWRFTAAGILDTTFGAGNGYVVLGLNVISGTSIDIDISAGKPLIFYQVQKVFSGPGYPFPTTRTVSYLTRLRTDGSADSTFGTLGNVYIPYTFSLGSGITVAPASGKIYVFGLSSSSFYVLGGSNAPRIFRFLTGGLADPGFPTVEAPTNFDSVCYDENGPSAGTSSVQYQSLMVQNGDNILVSSASYNLGGWTYYQANTSRFLSNGFPDQIYGGAWGGKCEVSALIKPGDPPFFVSDSRISRVVQQSDGRFIFGVWDSAYPYLKRRLGNGDIDPSFQPTLSLGLGTFLDILIQTADGKVVILSRFPDHNWSGYKLLRLLP